MINWIKKKPLRTQLIMILCLAIGPAAGLSIWQGITTYNRQIRQIERTLADSARLAGEAQISIITAAQPLLEALAAQPVIQNSDYPACATLLENSIKNSLHYSRIIAVDLEGNIKCSTIPVTEQLHFGDHIWLQETVLNKSFTISGLRQRTLTNRHALGVSTPIFDQDEKIVGILAMNVKLSAIERDITQSVQTPAKTILLDQDGNFIVPLETPTSFARNFPNRNIVLPYLQDGRALFTAKNGLDESWLYAIDTVVKDKVYVLFGQSRKDLISVARIDLARSIATPLLIWIIGLTTLWFGIQRLVLRWVNYLKRIAAIYARGRYSVRPTRMVEAPDEFYGMGKTFTRMAEVIEQREAELESSLEQKNVLIREVHHRVKNNLQIITSLLNLQSRHLHDPREIEIFDTAKSRINALALVHRSLYEAESLQYVNLKEFLEELCQQLQKTGWGAARRVRFIMEIPSVAVTAETAVPLALLLTETITNAFKYAFEGRNIGNIYIILEQNTQGGAILRIRDDGVGGMNISSDKNSKGIGHTLIYAFAQQLGGQVDVQDDNGICWTITMPVFKTYTDDHLKK